MRVEHVDEPADEWNTFVCDQAGAQLGHAAQWHGILRRAYGLQTYALAARDAAGSIRGVLSLAGFRGLGGGRELISLPYLDASGPLVADPESDHALREAAHALVRDLGARALELRSIDAHGATGPASSAPRVDLRLALEHDEEAQWSAIGAKVRNQTRKAEKEGLTLGVATGADALDDFYDPFCENMRDLGSPVHGRRLFQEVLDGFGGAARVITCRGEGPSVGGLIAIDFAGTVSVPWASTLRSERQRCPNNLIYWAALRWAIARGAREFDFGRSPVGEGTYRFKKGWGAREVPLCWSRFDARRESLALRAIGDDARMKRLSEVWARLPVALTRVLGPPIRRRLSA